MAVWAFASKKTEVMTTGGMASSAVDAGWQIFTASVSTPRTRNNMMRLLRWNPNSATYVPIRADEVLSPHTAYWGYSNMAETSFSLGAHDARFPASRGMDAPPAILFSHPKAVGKNRFFFRVTDRSGRQTEETILIHRPDGVPRLSSRSRRPDGFSARPTGDHTATLLWRRPRQLEDGQAIPKGLPITYWVYKDHVLVAELVDKTTYEDPEPPEGRRIRYYVTAVLFDAAGRPLESGPSDVIDFRASRSLPRASPGQFEPPRSVTSGVRDVLRLKTGLSTFGEKTQAHIAYVTRGSGSAGDAVRYLVSDEAGKPGSFGASVLIAQLASGHQATDLALAVQGGRVSVVWTDRALSSGASRADRLFARASVNGGADFDRAVLIPSSEGTKRSLDAAYDKYGHHHLVWGEHNNVYYLRDLGGVPSNVFDVDHRKPAIERVQYQIYTEKVGGKCPCEDCWCDESYALSEEPDPRDPTRRIGPYVTWVEDTYVYEPSLHVDGDAVTVVGRQHRMWDNRPVPNEAWMAMRSNPVYEAFGTRIEGGASVRRMVGWRKTWKPSREAGDENAWSGLGFAFQYRYGGTWHEEDMIKVAQRPLLAGAWSHQVPVADGLAEVGWKQGTWQEGRRQSWRISLVDEAFDDVPDGTPSHPQVTRLPSGPLVAIFEKGSSLDPNQPGLNPIHMAYSYDGGRVWTSSATIATGYLPKPAVTTDGGLAILYTAAETPMFTVRAVQEAQAGEWVSSAALNGFPPRPIHARSHGRTSDTLGNVPQLCGHDGLFFAAWVREPLDPTDRGRIVVSRSSLDRTVSRTGIHVSGRVQPGRPTPVTVTLENRFYMEVGTSAEPGAPAKSSAHGAQSSSSASGFEDAVLKDDSFGIYGFSSSAHETHVSLDPVDVEGGKSTLWLASFPDVSLASSLGLSRPGDHPLTLARGGLGEPDGRVNVIENNIAGNYERAKEAQKNLFKFETAGASGEEWGYQVEYEGAGDHDDSDAATRALNSELFDRPEYRDARHLSGFERVWVYTQGIALAQLSRSPGSEEIRSARALARTLCGTLVGGASSKLGWPFSWNTEGDDWQDARLVTGANACAVHGLGRFITSSAFETLPSEEAKGSFRRCYRDALMSLSDHRRRLTLEDGRAVTLMTAGWTAAGLKNAAKPSRIMTAAGTPVTDDPSLRFGYYSVLDAIGYDTYSENPPKIKTCQEAAGIDCYAEPLNGSAWRESEITEAVWRALKRRQKADNVVTEHNLDVLAVLNHALGHRHALGLKNRPELEVWRDELRDGIFYALWDDEGYQDEFRAELASMADQTDKGTSMTKAEIARQHKRIRWMQNALEEKPLGRVITGGRLQEDAEGALTLVPSRHSAIDNCSWLALSVDYQALAAHAAAKSGECVYRTPRKMPPVHGHQLRPRSGFWRLGLRFKSHQLSPESNLSRGALFPERFS